MARTIELGVDLVGFQARTAGGGEPVGEVQGVSRRGLRIHKIPGHMKRAGHLPAEAIASVDHATDTILLREGIGLRQVLDAPAPPDEGPDAWHMSNEWWADLLGHYGLYEAEGRGNEPFLHADQK